MKQYALFGYDQYYPLGGWEDYKGSFDTPEEAVTYAHAISYQQDYWQVVDLHTGSIVNQW